AIGGKTGTAEMVPRDKTNYVVSFIGFAPADDPQIVVYCVIDRPNVADQPHATYATAIVKSVLTEVLPYLHISRTEEMTIAEQEEAENLLGNLVGGTNKEDGNGDGSADGEDGNGEGGEDGGNGENGDGENPDDDSGKPFYVVDPNTGELINPDTGEPAEMNYSYEGNGDNNEGDAQTPAGEGGAQ
ncbi:MAG: peptidoglycan glycosyltransferase, partial [Lachnospiraceae bacterium]|nr:peptidoglycan glycosyltransferase [Lachnospiraceae bacterium]